MYNNKLLSIALMTDCLFFQKFAKEKVRLESLPLLKELKILHHR
jgi:hypothetical protein